MNCRALAPVPITATRRPSQSMSWRQAELWNRSPAKSSIPSMSGMSGRLSWPTADTTAPVVMVSALFSCSVQRRTCSSQDIASTPVPKRMRSRMPQRRAQSRK